MKPLVELKDVAMSFGHGPVLEEISFALSRAATWRCWVHRDAGNPHCSGS